ncbi:hypothetical protein P167DRAFT_535530 [Morchella conica CCBAS932]|uniref:Uncharacterized protein n=1 Tax=Morchella conica CCBAS932 TaxID=1392247 RepID=A0A3N4KQP4_9PEZI|nr:hypothetical protein P167DRAFT_535530 [Morchella conica CCBAS932]
MATLMHALSGSTALLGHLVGGDKVAANRGLHTALKPARRDALAHMVIYHEVSDLSGEKARRQARVDMTEKVARLRELTPRSGPYVNEVSEPFSPLFFPRAILAAFNLWWRGKLMTGSVVL